MSKLPDKVEGGKATCGTCKNIIVCRMTQYTNYDNYLQWQNHDENKAHYTSTGECKCPKDKYGTTTTPEPTPQPDLPKPVSNLNLIDVDAHNQCWAFAINEAHKVYPVNIKGGNLSTGAELKTDTNFVARMILAQVFYKKNMDLVIHSDRSS